MKLLFPSICKSWVFTTTSGNTGKQLLGLKHWIDMIFSCWLMLWFTFARLDCEITQVLPFWCYDDLQHLVVLFDSDHGPLWFHSCLSSKDLYRFPALRFGVGKEMCAFAGQLKCLAPRWHGLPCRCRVSFATVGGVRLRQICHHYVMWSRNVSKWLTLQ